jgi:hypothetical protein
MEKRQWAEKRHWRFVCIVRVSCYDSLYENSSRPIMLLPSSSHELGGGTT